MANKPAPELFTEYKSRIIPALREKHGYKNVNEIPKVSKVVVNTSVGAGSDSKEALEIARQEIATITGQRPITTVSKKSIANFKLREGQAIGAKVTLRGARRCTSSSSVSSRCPCLVFATFAVSTKAFDGNGNYTLGVADQSIFPEIELDKIKRNIGFDITIVTTARTNAEAKSLLTELGMPFADKAKKAPVQKTEEQQEEAPAAA